MVPTWTGNLKKTAEYFPVREFDQSGESEKILGKSRKFVRQKNKNHGNMA